MVENKALEFWVVVSAAIVAAIGWVIKTYTTFAKQKTVDKEFAALEKSNDDRFSAVQSRLMKAIDEVKQETRAKGVADLAVAKELHKRIDKVLETAQTLAMTIGELKGAFNSQTQRSNEK
jgi:hypothetical protein